MACAFSFGLLFSRYLFIYVLIYLFNITFLPVCEPFWPVAMRLQPEEGSTFSAASPCLAWPVKSIFYLYYPPPLILLRIHIIYKYIYRIYFCNCLHAYSVVISVVRIKFYNLLHSYVHGLGSFVCITRSFVLGDRLSDLCVQLDVAAR